MTEKIIPGNDWIIWMEQFVHPDKSGNPASHESWDKTDRIFQFPARSAPFRDGSGKHLGVSHAARGRWLREHDVTTEFLDAGIGCCWFAQQGDDEPVCGETEDAAIARLARENGLPGPESPEMSHTD